MAESNEANRLDPSPEESLVTVFSSSNHDAEMESMTILGVLQSNGIPAVYVGPHVLPNLEFGLQVPEHLVAEAQRIIDEARAGGEDAADQAEAATEA